MKKTAKRYILPLLALCIALLLGGCGDVKISPINEGETYVEGSWYFSDAGLDVGYNLFADGGGYQFIGSIINPIRYGIYEGNIYISVGGGEAAVFSYEQTEKGLLIAGLLYEPVEEDPAVAASIEAMLEAQSSQPQTSEDAKQIGIYISAALTVAFVVFIMIWFSRTMKKRGGKL